MPKRSSRSSAPSHKRSTATKAKPIVAKAAAKKTTNRKGASAISLVLDAFVRKSQLTLEEVAAIIVKAGSRDRNPKGAAAALVSFINRKRLPLVRVAIGTYKVA